MSAGSWRWMDAGRSVGIFFLMCLLICVGGGIATARDCVAALPFVPEPGTKAPAWIGHSLDEVLSDRLSLLPDCDVVGEETLCAFYTEEGLASPIRAWSNKQLSGIGARCALQAIMAGRYSLSGETVRVRCRVWTLAGAGETQTSMKLSEAHYKACDLVESVVRLSRLAARRPARPMPRPCVANSRSFEMLGRVWEAYTISDKEGQRAAKEWAKVDSTSTIAAYRQLFCIEDSPKQRALKLEALVREAPSDGTLWSALAAAREEAGDLDGAVVAYEKALARDPNSEFLCCSLAALYRKLGRPGEAARTLAKADSFTRTWQDHLWRGRTAYEDKDYVSAVKHLSIARKLGAPRCYTLDYLGYAYYEQDKWDDALDAWDESLRINPKSARMLYGTGCCYWKLEGWPKAEKSSRLALKLAPKSARIRCGLAQVLLMQRKFREAEKEAKAVLKADPDDSRAHRVLESSYMRRGDSLSALYHLVLSHEGSRRTLKGVAIGIGVVVLLGMIAVALAIRRHLAADGPGRGRE